MKCPFSHNNKAEKIWNFMNHVTPSIRQGEQSWWYNNNIHLYGQSTYIHLITRLAKLFVVIRYRAKGSGKFPRCRMRERIIQFFGSIIIWWWFSVANNGFLWFFFRFCFCRSVLEMMTHRLLKSFFLKLKCFNTSCLTFSITLFSTQLFLLSSISELLSEWINYNWLCIM